MGTHDTMVHVPKSSALLTASAVMFDNDGVLVDSHDEVEQAWRQLADEFQLDFELLRTSFVGRRAPDTLGAYLTGDDLGRAVERLEDLEVQLAVHTRPLAGAIKLVSALAGRRWTVVTSASTRLAAARWNGAGIPAPGRPVSADHVSAGKPDPEPYLVGAQQLDVDPAECIVFEDSPAGGESARRAGAAVVAVGDQTWPFEPAARITDLCQVVVEADHRAPIALRFTES